MHRLCFSAPKVTMSQDVLTLLVKSKARGKANGYTTVHGVSANLLYGFEQFILQICFPSLAYGA